MATSKEAKVKFTADTSEFTANIGKANSEMAKLRSELKLNSTQMKGTGSSVELLTKRQGILARESEASRSKIEALTAKLNVAKSIYGENSVEANRLATQLANARNAEERIQQEIAQVNSQLGEQEAAARKAGSSLNKLGENAGKLGDKLTSAGKKASAASAAIAGAGAASIAAFKEVDKGADNAIAATGAVGDAADEMRDSYKEVASSIVGDFSDIGSALGEVNTRFGFTDETLETATQDFMEFSKLTGMDVTKAVQKVARYMGDAGIEASQYKSVLDQLTVAAQASGVGMDTLTESLTKYGAPMRALGFETQESIAILSSWEKAGVNTEIAFSGMKKAISNWSAAGKDSRVEFKKTLDEIAKCPDIASATTKAIEVFGAKAGPDLADAIQGGRFEYSEMLALIEGSQGALSGTFDETVDGAYQLELAMQNAKLASAEVGESLSTTLAPMIDTASVKLRGFADWWRTLDSSTQQTIFTVAAMVAAAGPLLVVLGTGASAVSKMAQMMQLMRETQLLLTVATKGQAAAQVVLNAAMSANPIGLVVTAIAGLIAIFTLLWNTCEPFRRFWIGLWNGIKSSTKGAIDSVGKLITGISKPMDKAKKFVKAGIDAIKGFFSFKVSWPHIPMPHFYVQPSGWKVGDLLKGSIPKLGIEWYAKGGVLTKPTIFGVNGGNLMAGGEAGREAIAPIGVLQGYVRQAVAEGGGSGNTTIINGISYDDGSAVSAAVEQLVRALRIDGRM